MKIEPILTVKIGDTLIEPPGTKSSCDREKMRKKLRNLAFCAMKLNKFSGVEDCRTYYSLLSGQEKPELVYVDYPFNRLSLLPEEEQYKLLANTIFPYIDFSETLLPAHNSKLQEIAEKAVRGNCKENYLIRFALQYRGWSILDVKFNGIPCQCLCYYYIHKKSERSRGEFLPAFLILNKELLSISNIKTLFKAA